MENNSFIAGESSSLVIPVVDRETRSRMNEELTKIDIMMRGREDTIDDLLSESKDQIDFAFHFLGFDVHVHFFMDMNRGAITIDGYVFENFPIADHEIENWYFTLGEIVLTFINTGIFNHMSAGREGTLVVEEHFLDENDLVLVMIPSPLMMENEVMRKILELPFRAIHDDLTKDLGGTGIPLVIHASTLERMVERRDFLTRDFIAKLMFKIHERRIFLNEKDQRIISGDDFDDYLRRIIGKEKD